MKMKIVKPQWVKHGDGLSIFSIDIHPDGSRVATGGQGNDCGRVVIWNLAPIVSLEEQLNEHVPKLLCQLDSHLQCVNSVRWSNSGNFLASAGDDHLIMIWTLSGRHHGPGPSEQYRTVATLRSHSGDILDLSWSHDDQWLASCSIDNMIVVWNAMRWPEIVTTLKGHSGLVKGVTWDPIGKYLASQSDDKTLRVWRVSDWSEEAVITEPFEQCGGTTHVLRLSWSPDGQFLVSAQAMNNCGSVAKIIDRQDWSAEKDFVGHRKAIPCVRFNPNIFQYRLTVKKRNNEHNEPKYRRQCVLAMGSRDRSISIWTTANQRPMLVLSNVFENTVLDLSWSKSGYQLMACSVDGSVVYLEFSHHDLGLAFNQQERSQYLQQIYGNSIGNKSAHKHNLIEDVNIMILHSNKQQQQHTKPNGIASKDELGDESAEAATAGVAASSGKSSKHETVNSNSSSALSTKTAHLLASPGGMRLAKGPTDKQIEIRSADGRRRIIPLFIPPCSDPATGLATNSSASLSAANPSQQTFSSSSESKSKIVIETHDESSPSSEYFSYYTQQIPNGSLNNHTNKFNSTSEGIQNTFKNGNTSESLRKSGNAEVSDTRNLMRLETNSDESRPLLKEMPPTSIPTSGTVNDAIKSNQIDSSSESSSEMVVIRRNKNISIKRKSVDNVNNSVQQPAKRKPGRPPGSGKNISNEANLRQLVDGSHPRGTTGGVESVTSVSSHVNTSNAKATSSSVIGGSKLFFSPNVLVKQAQLSVKLFIQPDSSQIYTASIEYPHSASSFSKLSLCIDSEPVWTNLLASPITLVSGNEHIMACVCQDLSLNIFNTNSGSRVMVPIIFDTPVAKLSCLKKSFVLAICCDAHLWLWDMSLPKALLKRESMLPLVIDPITSEKLSILNATVIGNKPVVAISNGRSYIYHYELETWCLVADSNSPLNACSDLKSSNLFRGVTRLPSRSLLNYFSTNTHMAQHGTISFIEQQLENAKTLANGEEYREWLLILAQNLVSLHSSGFNCTNIETRLRELCNFLLGQQFPTNGKCDLSQPIVSTPISWRTSRTINTSQSLINSKSVSSNRILGHDKHDLLREVLTLLTSNISLQRLYNEFNDQLESFTPSLNSTYLNSSKAQTQVNTEKQ